MTRVSKFFTKNIKKFGNPHLTNSTKCDIIKMLKAESLEQKPLTVELEVLSVVKEKRRPLTFRF